MPRHLLYATSCACQWAPSMGALSCAWGAAAKSQTFKKKQAESHIAPSVLDRCSYVHGGLLAPRAGEARGRVHGLILASREATRAAAREVQTALKG